MNRTAVRMSVFLLVVGVSTAVKADVNVLRLPETICDNLYQTDFAPGQSWCWVQNFTDGSYAVNWYGSNYNGCVISYRLDRLYDLSTFRYGDNTNDRVQQFQVAAGSGAGLLVTDTSVNGSTVTPMSGSIVRRGGTVRWRATSFTDNNHGGTEFELYGMATDYLRIANPTIQGSYTAYNANYAASLALNNKLTGYLGEYASLGGGTNTYIVFDFGTSTLVSAVEIWDRNTPSGIRSGRLTFSDDLTFGDTGDVVANYTKDANDPASVVDLAATVLGVTRRYMKWQVTQLGTDGNVGMGEISFYALPTPTWNVANGDFGTNGSWKGNTAFPTGIAPAAEDGAIVDFGVVAAPVVHMEAAHSVRSLTLAGSGSLTVNGGTSNVLTVSGPSGITVAAGQTLQGSASVASPVTVNGGALGGSLQITGNVASIGGRFTPGGDGVAGTLQVTGNVTMDADTVLDFDLGASGTIGGGENDLIAITGDLTLDGTLNVSDLIYFTGGTYDLLTYTGTLTDNGLSLGTAPMTDYYGYSLVVGDGKVSVEVIHYYPSGDVNHDTSYNSLDIDAIYAHFGPVPPNYQWDVNGDDVVDQADVTHWLTSEMVPRDTCGVTNYGDANLDAFTDFTDFQALLDHWQGNGGWADADFSGNGFVDFEDFQILLDYWNPTGWSESQGQVPEPASLTLLALGAVAMLKRRRNS